MFGDDNAASIFGDGNVASTNLLQFMVWWNLKPFGGACGCLVVLDPSVILR